MDGLVTFPKTLGLAEQGLFALGYYHQRQDSFKKQVGGPENGGSGNEEGAAA